MELAKPGFTPRIPKENAFLKFIEGLVALLLRAVIIWALWNYYIVPYFDTFTVTYLLVVVVLYILRLTFKRK